jgi:hypothetical protein
MKEKWHNILSLRCLSCGGKEGGSFKMSCESIYDIIIEERNRLRELSMLYHNKARRSRMWKSEKYRERAKVCIEEIGKLNKIIKFIEEEVQ